MQSKKLIWAQIAYISNKLPHYYSQTKTHKSLYLYSIARANLTMRDEITSCSFVNTWVGWGASNLGQILAKMEDELEQGWENREEWENREAWARTGRSSICRDIFSPGLFYQPVLKVPLAGCHHTFSPGLFHQPGLKRLTGPPSSATTPLVSVCLTNRD